MQVTDNRTLIFICHCRCAAFHRIVKIFIVREYAGHVSNTFGPHLYRIYKQDYQQQKDSSYTIESNVERIRDWNFKCNNSK